MLCRMMVWWGLWCVGHLKQCSWMERQMDTLSIRSSHRTLGEHPPTSCNQVQPYHRVKWILHLALFILTSNLKTSVQPQRVHKRCIQMIVSLGMSNCTGGILASNSGTRGLVSGYLYTPKWYPSPCTLHSGLFTRWFFTLHVRKRI